MNQTKDMGLTRKQAKTQKPNQKHIKLVRNTKKLKKLTKMNQNPEKTRNTDEHST
jgi:hypothetical protein